VDLLAREASIDLDALAWDDAEVYELLQRGDTVGVFQLESEGMRRTLAAVKPTNFGDIIALVSLYRPGPMDNIPLFGRRKNGLGDRISAPEAGRASWPKPTASSSIRNRSCRPRRSLRAIRSVTLTCCAAPWARRSRRKWMPSASASSMAASEVSGIDAAKANELFDLIDKFAGYGFNKSHAAAYALLAYQTAWLKTHYPHEFYAASMNGKPMALLRQSTISLTVSAQGCSTGGRSKALPAPVRLTRSSPSVQPFSSRQKRS
jgi:DNA polymerase-3 subunit alpha